MKGTGDRIDGLEATRRLKADPDTSGIPIMSDHTAPRIRTLGREECAQILARNHVGRIAYADGGVEIEPLNYVYHDGWL